jgi:hypothetical protein
MTLLLPLFAFGGELGLPGPSKGSRLVASDLMLILMMGLLIFAVLIAYFVFIRGPKSEIQISPKRVHKDDPEPDDAFSQDPNARRRKKKRVRRRDHRQRNPTLSQTAGLPPPRGSEPTSSP